MAEEAQRCRPRRHSPHGHAAPAPGWPHDECVPGGRQPALRRAGSRGRGRQLQRVPQRAQRRAGQLRLQQEEAAHRQRQEAGVGRAAPQSHEDRDAATSPPTLPARASSGLGAQRRLHARHVTPARHGPPKQPGDARRRGGEPWEPSSSVRMRALGGAVPRARGSSDKDCSAGPGVAPLPRTPVVP